MGLFYYLKLIIGNIIKILIMAARDKLPSNIQYKNPQFQPNNESSSLSSSSEVISSSHMQEEGSSNYDINQQDYYEVETILDKRVKGGKAEYLVKWKDWNKPQHNTWENMNNLKNVKHLVIQFQNQLKKKKSQTSKPIRKQDKTKNIQEKLKQLRQLVEKTNKKSSEKPGQQVSKPEQKTGKPEKPISPHPISQKIPKKPPNPILTLDSSSSSSSSQQNSYTQKNISTQLSNPNNNLPPPPPKKSRKQAPRLQSHPSLKSIDSLKSQDSQLVTLKPALRFGNISNHYVQNGKIFYELNVFNQGGLIVGVRRIQALQLRDREPGLVREYLERSLVDYERFYAMEKQYQIQLRAKMQK